MKYILFTLIIICFFTLYIVYNYQTITKYENNLYSGLYIGNSEIGGTYGRGVFANKKYDIGDIIESSPYIIDKLNNFIGPTRDYVFTINSESVALAFGYASLYNHSDTPNARWYFVNDKLVFQAIKTINKNEEILISYGSNYWNSRKDISKI